MGWEITVGGQTRQFDSKADAERWYDNYLNVMSGQLGHGAFDALGRLAMSLSARVVRDFTETEEELDLSLSGKWEVLDPDSPLDTYIAQLEAMLDQKGYRLVDWEVGAIDDSNQFENPATGVAFYTDQIPLRYTVEPIPDVEQRLGFLDPSMMSPGGQFGAPIVGGMAIDDDKTQSYTVNLVHNKDENILADYQTFDSQLKQMDEQAIESGLEAEQIAMAAEVIRLEFEKKMWAKAKLVAEGMSVAAADKVWNSASKYMAPTEAANAATSGAGIAIGNLLDQGKTNIANSIAEAEFGSPNASLHQYQGVPTASAPKGSGGVGNDDAPPPEFDIGEIFDALMKGAGGYGSGSSKPEYRPPDRREVRDQVRGILSALVGTAENNRLERLTDKYMAAHRKAWDNPNAGLEPRMDVYEDIRKSDDYKRIHMLRPDTVAEEDWVSQRTYLGERYGLSASRAQSFGINAAIAGTAQGDLEDAASMAQIADSGRLQGSLLGRIKQNVGVMAQGLR